MTENSAMAHLEDALSSMMSRGLSLDKQLLAASKKILLQRIEFQPAQRTSSLCPLQKLRTKYPPLNASGADDKQKAVKNDTSHSWRIGRSEDGITVPACVLCAPESVLYDWSTTSRIGAGLANLGNTCFLNSTLQCLTYTAPLVNYLSSSGHRKRCPVTGFCMMCELCKHISQCRAAGSNVIKPLSILQKLRLIARHMRWGRQEDAHEFLRYVVDALQRSALVGMSNLDQRSKETTFVHQIFGGYLRSQVTCLRCNEQSNTFDPFLDLCMDVRQVGSIEMALQRFVQPELLSKENAYLCSRCKCKVTARKTLTIHRAPNVLTVQLKRYGVRGSKVTRHISFTERLDLRPYMSATKSVSVSYRLYAVLVHNGCTTNSGHYYCYVQSPGGTWHCMNDSSVHPTNIQRILQAEAYILFYIRNQPTSPKSTSSQQVSCVDRCSCLKNTHTAIYEADDPRGFPGNLTGCWSTM